MLDSRPDDPAKPLCNVPEAGRSIVFEERSPENKQHDLSPFKAYDSYDLRVPLLKPKNSKII